MREIVLDFETYYDKEYSLSKITTPEYVHSPLFEVIGVAVLEPNSGTPLRWFSGDFAETALFLKALNLEDARVICHNASFDGFILEQRFGIHPKEYFCTMFAARPIVTPFNGKMSLAATANFLNVGQKGGYVAQAIGKHRKDFTIPELANYAAYCKQDVSLTAFLYAQLGKQLPPQEHTLIDATVKKFTRPVLELDPALLERRRVEIIAEKQKFLDDAGLADKKALMSNPKFAELLKSMGVMPPTKISPTTGKETYAFAKTDPGFKDLLNHRNPKVQILTAARAGVKSTIEESRIAKLQNIGRLNKGLPVPLLYCGAHTTRFSGAGGINLQNLTRGSALREAIVAKPGHKLVAGDLSQIEARITACLADEPRLLESFARGDDVYSEFASHVYGREITKDNPKERMVGKVSILGLGYGMGPDRFKATLAVYGIDITKSEAKRVVYAYRDRYLRIGALWDSCENAIRYMAVAGGSTVSDEEPIQYRLKLGPVVTGVRHLVLPNGMRIFYPELEPTIDGWQYKYRNRSTRHLYGGAVLENIVQALARIVISDAEMFLFKRGIASAMQAHDELVYSILKEKVATFVPVLEKVLTRVPAWMPNLPLACEIGVGDNYGQCK